MLAMTGTRPAARSTVARTARARSASGSAANSPVVPIAHRPWTPAPTRKSTRRHSEASSTVSSAFRGVSMGTKIPASRLGCITPMVERRAVGAVGGLTAIVDGQEFALEQAADDLLDRRQLVRIPLADEGHRA